MKYESWLVKQTNISAVSRLTAAGYSPVCAGVLAARGVKDTYEAETFLSSDLSMLHDPFLMRDMDKAAERVVNAIRSGEKITVYGDYDVDGITATCLLLLYLKSRGADVDHYIPDRVDEGYGINFSALDTLKVRGTKLIVTVDTGVTAINETLRAAELGIDIVITDHHECRDILPAAAAVVNPHRRDCTYPFKALAGVGVAFKTACAAETLLRGNNSAPLKVQEELLTGYADLLAIGTVADIMPVLGENRTIVRTGLGLITHSPRIGIAKLISAAGCTNREVNSSLLGYTIAPRLNAAGRMCTVNTAVELLLENDSIRAGELAERLCSLNSERQQIESEILKSVTAKVESLSSLPPALILTGENWHQGVVGIVASRAVERYSRPALIISLDGDVGKGSARSVKGINLFKGLCECAELLSAFGGHDLAAGFTIDRENIDKFRARFCAFTENHSSCRKKAVLEADMELLPGHITLENISSLFAIEPFGAGNPQPVFIMRGVTATGIKPIGADKHTRVCAEKNGTRLSAVFFGATADSLGINPGDYCDMAFFLSINDFRGEKTPQLMLLDIRPSGQLTENDDELFTLLMSGGDICAKKKACLTPSRDEFAALWRYLSGLPADISLSLSQTARETSPRRAPDAVRVLVMLEVFSEVGLIEYMRSGDKLTVILKDNGQNKKADLCASELMQRLM